MLLKRNPTRSKIYLDFVRSLPCAACYATDNSDPHHGIDMGLIPGVGTTETDIFAIPLCRGCHARLHDDVPAWEAMYGKQVYHILKTLQKAEDAGVLPMVFKRG